MGISKFMMSLIIFTLIFLFVEKDQIIQKVQNEKKPTVSFIDSTMYEITEVNIKQIVKSKQTDIYNEREELKDATIVARSNNNSYDTNIVSSKNMIKIDDKVFLSDSVNLQLSNGTNIKTEQLNYNLKTKIAYNDVDFTAIRDTDTFKGNSLYLDSVNNHLKAEKTKFRMKVGNNE